MRTASKCMLLAAVVSAGATLMLVSKTRLDAAKSAAECMASSRDVGACSTPKGSPDELWEIVAAFAGLGALISGVSFFAGERQANDSWLAFNKRQHDLGHTKDLGNLDADQGP